MRTVRVLSGSLRRPMYGRHIYPRGSVKRVTVVMPLEMHKLLKFRSIQCDISMNDQILNAVKEYLQKSGYEKDVLG